jgi:predicted N-acetyltransferase YhbS
MMNSVIQAMPAIRLACDDDVPELERLIPVSVRALSEGFYTPAQTEAAVAHVFGVDRQLIRDGTYYVATADGKVVACGGWSRRKTMFGGDQTGFKDRGDPLLDPAVDAARLRAFFVHPAWARRGIGRRIIVECESAASAAGFRRLELVATLPGQPLYAASGYQVLEPLQIAMPDGSSLPAVRMAKQLDPFRATRET